MNSSTNNNINNLTTLERIQLETKEAIQRENELKARYSSSNKNFTLLDTQTNNKNYNEMENKVPNQKKKHSFQKFTKNNNGSTSSSSTKGLMYRFIKSRGKLASTPFNNNNNNSSNINWSNNNIDATFGPIKFSIEKGSNKSPRNGFVSAEEKMRKELKEFQERETELREERIKSQPNLMAALQLEDNNQLLFNRFEKNHHQSNVIRDEDNLRMNNSLNFTRGGLKTAKSMANLYNNNNNSDDGFEDASSSTTGGSLSLKPAKSLADLCDLSDEEIGLPGTQSLIMQFENMNFENRNNNNKDF